MTDDHGSSDEDTSVEKPSAMENAALARKKRLLAMKSKINGIEMKEEDYTEEAQATKRSKTDSDTYRSYQPISDQLGKVDESVRELDIVEKEIAGHLKDTMDTAVIENVDISTLAPRKVDWDLKRDIQKKLDKLERRTQRAVADLIRQRLGEGKMDLASTVNAGI